MSKENTAVFIGHKFVVGVRRVKHQLLRHKKFGLNPRPYKLVQLD